MQENKNTEANLLASFREAVGDDLRLIASLHDREIDAVGIAQLRAIEFPSGLGLNLSKPAGKQAQMEMTNVLAELPDKLDQAMIDELAVDFAAIYLTHRYRAAPTESVWLDKDHLERQQPMFQARAAYRRRGLKVIDWHKRSEDHLVTQLHFLAHLIGECDDEVALAEAGTFLDQHLLRWIGEFARTVAERCSARFYGTLSLLTAAYLDDLRDVLAQLLDQPRPEIKALEYIAAPTNEAEQLSSPVAPIAGPGW